MSEKILEDQLGYSQKFIDELRQLQKFLLSVTAKDVSMLITFRTIADPSLGKISMTIISIAFWIEELSLGNFKIVFSYKMNKLIYFSC